MAKKKDSTTKNILIGIIIGIIIGEIHGFKKGLDIAVAVSK